MDTVSETTTNDAQREAFFHGKSLSINDIKDRLYSFRQTREFDSTIIGIAGRVPNPEALSQAGVEQGIENLSIDWVVDREAGQAKFSTPEGYYSFEHDYPDIKETAEIKQTIFEAIDPTLRIIDADFRTRAGLDQSVATQCRVDFARGIIDKDKATSGDSFPHVDGSDEEGQIYYLVAIGKTTKLYPGHFVEKNKDRFQIQVPGSLAEQIEELRIEPVRPNSGEIVATDTFTVHSSPGEESIGQSRTFMRVSYDFAA